MTNRCRKCGTAILPSWKTCNDCDKPLPKVNKPERPSNRYMAKYQKDAETLVELQRKHPARKSKKR